jgi:hypothetical protein
VSVTARVRLALLACMAGLAVQLGASLAWSPLAFIVFASVGVPLVLLGVFIYLWTVFGDLRRRGAL